MPTQFAEKVFALSTEGLEVIEEIIQENPELQDLVWPDIIGHPLILDCERLQRILTRLKKKWSRATKDDLIDWAIQISYIKNKPFDEVLAHAHLKKKESRHDHMAAV